MRLATDQARGKGALTGACFLELEAQPPELGVDFFNTFQESSRHFRQKWFEAADFCIFNVGGVGTLEEIGIEMCNLKLGIRPRVPYVFFNAKFWGDLRRQVNAMIKDKRAPAWMNDYIIFSDDVKKTQAEFARFSRHDAEIYPAFDRYLQESASVVRKLLFETPVDPTKRDWKSFQARPGV